MPPTTPAAVRRVTFAPYDVTEKVAQKKPSATAFAIIRKALLQAAGKPTNVELPGSWRIAAELQMLFSDMEYKHEEDYGVMPDQSSPTGFREIRVPVIVLNPQGATFVVSEQHVQQLRSIFDEWVKSSGKYSEALGIHLAYQWFDGGNIVDASKESAVASGAVTPVGTRPAPVVQEPPAVQEPPGADPVNSAE